MQVDSIQSEKQTMRKEGNDGLVRGEVVGSCMTRRIVVRRGMSLLHYQRLKRRERVRDIDVTRGFGRGVLESRSEGRR